MNLKIVLFALLLLAASNPAFADAKSVTVQVSCTIPAMLEMAAPQTLAVKANSNLDNQLQMTQDLAYRDGKNIQVYSLTAL